MVGHKNVCATDRRRQLKSRLNVSYQVVKNSFARDKPNTLLTCPPSGRRKHRSTIKVHQRLQHQLYFMRNRLLFAHKIS